MNSLKVDLLSVPGRLSEISFTVDSGKVIGLVGPNGAGKSSLLQALAGLLVSSGNVYWNGTSLDKIPAIERARIASWIPQEAHFEFGFTVRSVVEQGRFAHGDDQLGINEVLEAFDLIALSDRPVSHISAGERARVLLARACITEAPIQFWDEPLAALDPRHRLETLRIARKLALKGSIIILSLHDLSQALGLDQVIVVNNGKLEAIGSPNEVLTDELLLRVFKVQASRNLSNLNLELPISPIHYL